jgi:DNA-binding beta-propeller fold protein YncE
MGLFVVLTGCGSVASSSPDGGTDAPATGGASGAAGAPAAGTAGVGSGTAGDSGGAGTSAGAGASGTAGSAGSSAGGASGGSPPAAFALETPANGDPTVSTTPTLSWQAAAGATTYDVEIATSVAFGAADVAQKTGITTPSFTPTVALQPGVIYYWRVTAEGGGASVAASNAPFAMSSPVNAGPSPHGVAVTPDGTTAVITNDKPGGSVTLLDLATFATQTIALMGQPAMVAVTPDGTRALVAEGSPNNVAVLDLAAKAIAGTVNPPCVATTLYGIAIKADGSAAVMPDFNGGCTKDVLDVIPLPGTTISSAIDLASSAGEFGVAVTPDGASAIVTRGVLTTTVKRVDLAGGGLTTISNTSSSFGVAVTADGKEALVTSGEGETIKRISLVTNAVTGTIMFETNQDVGNIGIAHGGAVAVAVGDFKVGVLSLADGSVTSTFSLTGRSVAVTPDGHRALVTGAGAGGKVYVLALP